MPHPLNPFPGLLDFAFFAPFLIRVVAGVIFVDLGYLALTKDNERLAKLFGTFLGAGSLVAGLFGFVQIIAGALLAVGLFTQLAALALSLVAFMNLYLEMRNEALVRRDIVFHLMLLSMALSLLLSGAGIFALDLPL